MQPAETRCVVPDRPIWGWAVQLYSLRSETDPGIGDLASLRTLAAWSAAQGAAFVLASPLHALAPGQVSPYFPTSRCFRDINVLRGPNRPPQSRFVAGLTDRDGARAAKVANLGAAAAEAPPDADRDEFIEEQGELLRAFAAFEVLASRLGWDYRVWPADVRGAPRMAVDRVWADAAPEAEFSCFVQWAIDAAVRSIAETGCPVVNDIAVGVDPGGFDAWWWQEGIANGFSVGAPPDAFNPNGQQWGAAVFDPEWLRTQGDGPLGRAWAMAARHAAGLRIDHVAGLSRQFWIPEGTGPDAGEYVAYPFDDLLPRLVEVSDSTGVWVVGEDLGTIEPGLRERLARWNVLSTKVIRFETDPPAAWPELALGTASTHDLPPLTDGAGEAHRALAASPCLAVAATLEDTLGVVDPANRPGVDHPHNWRQSLPFPVERLVRDPQMRATADLMALRSR